MSYVHGAVPLGGSLYFWHSATLPFDDNLIDTKVSHIFKCQEDKRKTGF